MEVKKYIKDGDNIEKRSNISKPDNKGFIENISSLRTEVTSLRAAPTDRDVHIAAPQSDMQHP